MGSIRTQRKLLSLAVAAALGSLLAAPVVAQEAATAGEWAKEEKATTLS